MTNAGERDYPLKLNYVAVTNAQKHVPSHLTRVDRLLSSILETDPIADLYEEEVYLWWESACIIRAVDRVIVWLTDN